jgi:capsular polysaccharide export protein
VAHVATYLRQMAGRRRRQAALARVVADPAPLFLALLQRPGDSQLSQHSDFAGLKDFERRVIDSFARHADPAARLLFKSHPLDHGLEPHPANIRRLAEAAGVADRVFFTDGGHFPSLVGRSAGVVTINSTGALAALEVGRPAVVLGEAIFDMPGLTHQGGLERFWRQGEAPDAALFESYRAVLMARTQINGAYSTRAGIEMAVPEAARRLLRA